MLLTSRIAMSNGEMFALTVDEDSEIKSKGPQLTKFGGVSGAPVFASKERGLTLVGVINQCTPVDNGVLDGHGNPATKDVAFYAAHADVIAATGELAGR
jgi:hypothetical protein